MNSLVSLLILYFMYRIIRFMINVADDVMPKYLNYIKYFIIKRPSAKWRTRRSIYAQIRQNKSNPDLTLIDEPRESEFKLSYGMADALNVYDRSYIDDDRISELSQLFVELAQTGSRDAGTRIYKIIESYSFYSFTNTADRIIDKILENQLNNFPYLYFYACDLVKHSVNRNAVKLGLAIMALCHQKQAIKIAMRVGRHEEFGLWAVHTIKMLGHTTNTNVSNKIFNLSTHLHGWGRIALCWNNAHNFTTTRQKDWLFFEGTKTFSNYYELPDVCIKNGEFAQRMATDKISQKTFDMATDIIDKYLDYNANLSFNELEPMRDWIRHSKYHIKNARDVYVLYKLRGYMLKRKRKYEKAHIQSGTQDAINIAANTLKQIPIRDIILRDITNPQISFYASQLIVPYGMDLFDELWNILKANPQNLDIWNAILYCARVQTPRRYKIKRLIEFTNNNLSSVPDAHTELFN